MFQIQMLTLLVSVFILAQVHARGRYGMHKPVKQSDDWYEDLTLTNPNNNANTRNTETKDEKQDRLMGQMSRQMILMHLAMEERIRTDGDSGIKNVRNFRIGRRPYNSDHHSVYAMASIHEHAETIRTVGLGEFVAVLNGYEFRTRHNDYLLMKPHDTKPGYHATQEVPFPDVPPAVKNKDSVTEQIEEMQLWFKAFAEQDFSVRDYRKYFKPILCYLEGAWTKLGDTIDEPFVSNRHHLDAKSWYDLQQKIRFNAYTGRKNPSENYAFLPTTLFDYKDGKPVFGQWNYRIMCHPLNKNLPTSKLVLVDDLASRMTQKLTFEKYKNTRAARFEIHNEDEDDEEEEDFGLLDRLMSQIPGKDNYVGNIIDNAAYEKAYSADPNIDKKVLNAAYYHRQFKVGEKGAMGLDYRIRGFADRNLFVALNTQDKIIGLNLTICDEDDEEDCKTWYQQASYAVPLEVIYLTPLSKWNPYNIKYKGDPDSDEGETVTEDKGTGNIRDGDPGSKKSAFNGTNSDIYYRTPHIFFSKNGNEDDAPADTAAEKVGVLDQKGNLRIVSASGIYIFTPKISGVGNVRLRYPVAPVHGEGSGVWKELEALKDVVMEMQKYSYIYREGNETGPGSGDNDMVNFKTSLSTNEDQHHHTFKISKAKIKVLKEDDEETVKVKTSRNTGHSHVLIVKYNPNIQKFVYVKCDTKKRGKLCWDGHKKVLIQLS